MHVNTLLTHEHPDLDGLVGCWLLKRHGSARFPGIETATLRFAPAGMEPDGKSPAQYETEGVLAVDIGGGRFDNHLQGELHGDEADLKESATSLIGRALGLCESPSLKSLVEFVRLQDIQGRSIGTKNAVDHSMALVSILRGLHLLNRDDYAKTFEEIVSSLDAIAASTEDQIEVLDWYRSERPCTFTAMGVAHHAANHFDAALARWLLERHKSKLPAIGARELATGGSAARVVARTLGLDERPEYAKLLEFSGLERVLSQRRWLSDLDFSVTSLNILRGCHRLENDGDLAAARMGRFFDAALAVEQDWHAALAAFNEASRIVDIKRDGLRVRICAFESDLPAMTRVARFKAHPDICLHRDSAINAIGITIGQHKGPLLEYTFDGRAGHPADPTPRGQPRLDSMTARLRAAEAFLIGEALDIDRINDVGMVHGWFMHQSLRILAKGSRKARDVPPTLIRFDDLVAIVASTFDPARAMPETFCNDKLCRKGACAFVGLRLLSCQRRSQAGSVY